ncbi:4-aminobutyrate--2-oxoglutarate transaminase [Paraburkholderia sp. 22099]|uniref:4-aminobutyrate aminotransferase/4-aminobutyrate aminotransferase/(S)-3-amino-2-methylpropionate transaminase n=1 Tax=Paraburkholderia terricola TaxID=169427 RepID=A0ABU1LYX7_9BURK|nr:4-aminobutyrate--2-oxoglutarate transaminase [Paraburkholderia terricola]MDR6411963.1 4-aminobutyrate aminotransferase/4-aminobutyrate aminotransferase/(S)-3-amino-2-methylpropionate transaminase [Paraburkholderia terricola]MDR6484531.1 4-aminobutyrate aminotransferase/4-aminobutyrate aminotransferase/(S)-3-amino-2-methylpropionate transaminase [Paraburkholderia terricola]MDR6491398.1 4-aminobutyrate aminotransferase/4-aminobutyrate aminotransferase/(S)-3-amino-2-methylpropionate transaminase
MKNAELKSRKDAATPRGVGVMCDFYAERAENAELWDVEGRRFIDFAAGIAVCNTGHRHPKILAAIRDQLDHFTHTAYQIVPYASYVELAEKINQRAPGDYPKKTAFFTTGAEAVENAIKIARAATGRPGVIAFTGGFHGRTLMGMALTGKVAPYKIGFGPFPSDVFHAPFPNPLHGVTTADSLKAIDALFKADIDPKRVAAIIFEPVQGEGGFYSAPAEFVRALRKLCNEHGILLIADEVQTGFARTGKLFAMHHHDVVPDLMTMAKSLAGGMPLSGVVGRADVMDAAAPGGLGGTYAGNPLAIAAAHAVLDIIDEEKLCERATVLGDRVKAKLIALQGEVPQIADVRGPGGMVAVEFCKAGSTEPDAEFTRRVQTRALERGLLLLVCGVYSNVVRFLFPLTIQDSVFDEAMVILEGVIRDSVAVGV